MNLSNKQKSVLAQMARATWDRWGARASYTAAKADELGDPLLSEAQAFTHWRHEQQERATGRKSLRDLTQEDYLQIRAWWENFFPSGSGKAFATLVRQESDGQRRAYRVLKKALAERGLPEAYAEAICRKQYKCGLQEASEGQTWRLVYTVRSRRKAVSKAMRPQPVGGGAISKADLDRGVL